MKQCALGIKACLCNFAVPFAVIIGSHNVSHSKGFDQQFFLIGSCEAAENTKLIIRDVGKQKAGLESVYTNVNNCLSKNNLHDARSSTELLEFKLGKLQKDLSSDEFHSWKSKVDKAIKAIAFKEDSLVTRTIEILHTQGIDQSLQFMQNDLRLHGVSESKLNSLEKKILDEAPQIKQTQEREAIARALKVLESRQVPDKSFDPYIVKTAQRILQAREDSVKRIEDAKKQKVIEAQEKQEKIRLEKEKKEAERLVKLKQEEEKKLRAEENERIKRKEASEKEKQRLAALEELRRKKLLDQQVKARNDSIEAERKVQERKMEITRESQHRIEESRKERERAIIQQQGAQRDSIEAARKHEAVQEKEKLRLARIEEVRQKQMLAQQEKARKDSVLAQRKQTEAEEKEAKRLSRIEAVRQSQLLVKQEVARMDSIERQRKFQQEQLALSQKRDQEPMAVQKQPQTPLQEQHITTVIHPPEPQSAVIARQETRSKEEPSQTVVLSKSGQGTLQKLRENQKWAQDLVVVLYEMLDNGKNREALADFKINRKFISQFVDAEVFNTLEQSVFQKSAQDLVIVIYTLVEQGNGKGAMEKFKQNRKFIAQYIDKEVFAALEQTVVQTSSSSSRGQR
ncbi:MAG: hypothetical protein WBM07_17935 [Chitinivibrionales bacterium]